jgi:endonuclease/exonuclease/phosphatase family metal-dependent hydrolase
LRRSVDAHHSQHTSLADCSTLSILSYNVQVGIHTRFFRDYWLKGWQHVLPSHKRRGQLKQLSGIMAPFDIVGLQEVDGGSLRTGNLNQVEYLAHRTGHRWWYQQLNRNLGVMAQHSNGLMSRIHPLSVEEHPLPGRVRGRGVLIARFGNPDCPLVLVVAHLALGAKAREAQLDYVLEAVNADNLMLVGDLNAEGPELMAHPGILARGLQCPTATLATWPSWAPEKALDHVLLSPGIGVRAVEVLPVTLSDHCPVMVEIEVPLACRG